ncbi:MAG: rRNA maturation RNase YbeY [Candidatus Omnitrophica bacterium]|nr:rRNA maturation RNase YbeY [Candidatus Omnitrophota bacterium]
MPINSAVARHKKRTGCEVDVWAAPAVEHLVPDNSLRSLHAAAKRMLLAAGVRTGRVSVAFLSGADMRRLNRKHLGHDYVTDVVTFDLGGEVGSLGKLSLSSRRRVKTVPSSRSSMGAVVLLGEICICPAEARRNARQYGEPFERELKRYLAHGILHLLGWDDATDRLRAAMRKQEDALLSAVSAPTACC